MPSLNPIYIIASALPGLAFLAWAIRGNRSQGRKRCPRCWYDMSAAPTLTCPECGHTARSTDDLQRPRRRWRWATLAALLALAAPAALLAPPIAASLRAALTPKWKTLREIAIGNYTVREMTTTDGMGIDAVEIRRDGHLLARQQGFRLNLGGGNRYDAPLQVTYGLGEDITGDKIPDLIVEQTSGASGCYSTFWLYSLRPDADFEGSGPDAVFHWCGYWDDLDHDGRIEFIAYDRTFSYRWTSGAGSPYPKVVFTPAQRLDDYVIDEDLMREPPPSPEALQELIDAARDQPDWYTHVEFILRRLFDLIYSGNESAAWDFFDRAYNPARNSGSTPAAKFKRDLQNALTESPFHLPIQGLQNHSK